MLDLVVIGGGTAGLVATKTAARLGARVLLIERDRLGGDCLWTGCVPSKALVAVARSAASARAGSRWGVQVTGVQVDFAGVMAHVRAAMAEIEPADSAPSVRAVGGEVLIGDARFTAPDRVQVDGRDIRFRQAVIATGARPLIPPIPGVHDAGFLTSETVWALADLPARMAVLGGGSIGCELGQAFARLGARVVLIEGGPRLLPREDPEAAAAVQRALVADGVEVRTGQPVTEVQGGSAGSGRGESGGGELRLADGQRVGFDRLLIGAGRVPRTDGLGLDAAEVELDHDGFVVVDAHLRTTNPRIRAAGDITGHPQFTHVAGMHGALAASNAVLGLRRSVDGATVPRVTYTDPELAAVGVDTGQSPDGGRILTLRHHEIDRAVTDAATEGLTRIAVDRRGRIVGATVVGPRAGETLGELTLAVAQALRPRDLAAVTHAYPTWNDGPWKAVLADVRAGLEGPLAARAVAAAVGVRRWWLDARDR